MARRAAIHTTGRRRKGGMERPQAARASIVKETRHHVITLVRGPREDLFLVASADLPPPYLLRSV